MLMDSEFEEAGRPEPSSRGMAQSIRATVVGTLHRRWWMLLIVSAVVMVAGTVLVFMLPTEYVGNARIRIEPSRAAVLGDLTTARPDQGAIDTEASVIRSHEIVSDAVRRLNLDRDPVLVAGMPPLTMGEADRAVRIDAVARRIMGDLTVAREGLTYIVNVRYETVDPALAARVATGIAKAYIAFNERRRLASLEREVEFLDQRRVAAEAEARSADAELAQYRAAAGIVQSGEATVVDQQINPLSNQVATAESDASATRARLDAAQRQIARGGIDAVSAVLGSPVIGGLRAQRALLVERQGEITARYGEKHPETVKIRQQLSALDEQIEVEAKRVIGGLESEAVASEARAKSLRADLVALERKQASDARKAAAEDSFVRSADAANARYMALVEQQQTQSANETTVPQAVLVDEATVPLHATSPNRPLLLIAIAFLALFTGGAVVATQEILSTAVRSVSDIEQLGVPVFATIPHLRVETAANVGETIIKHPMSGFAEAYRVVRRALLGRPQPPRTIAIVSALPGEGKTSSALALGRVMALAGERVVIVDTDLRRGRLIEESGGSGAVGLVSVLRGEQALENALVADRVERCYLLPAIGETFLAEDLLGGESMRALLDRLGQSFDRVLLDTPPLLGIADARAVAALSDAVLMTARWGHTPLKALQSAIGSLAIDHTIVDGVVLTMVSANSSEETGLYHSRRYAQYYRA
jgi:uncharacterized protein involved in exopolysaccharide biosynthesis/Mrp family chromosome partitioning ATPase